MDSRQRDWPRSWLMTDERMGDRLWEAIERLPIGDGGVVVRHYGLPNGERADLAREVGRICRRRGLILAVAADVALGEELGAELIHRPRSLPGKLPFSMPVHSLEDARTARRDGASLAFVSPVHQTRSHPDAVPLGRKLVRQIVKAVGCPAIALGGMDARKFAAAEKDGFYGWAAIDAWIRT
jgi:thiamine-phosphate pyrophosphorylase